MEVMLDLEALQGFHEDPRVLAEGRITAIGAVRFDVSGDEYCELDTFEARVDLCAPDGGRIDPDTLRWWLQQTPEAQHYVFPSVGPRSVTLAGALVQFDVWLQFDDRIWCHNYDRVLVTGAWARTMAAMPKIPWRKLRDFGAVERFVELAGADLLRPANPHTPVEDARLQAKFLHSALRMMRKGCTT